MVFSSRTDARSDPRRRIMTSDEPVERIVDLDDAQPHSERNAPARLQELTTATLD